MSRYHNRGLEPPETTRLDRVSIVRAQTQATLDLLNQVKKESREEEHEGPDPYTRVKTEMAVRCAEEFVGRMVKEDLILFRQFRSDHKHLVTMQMEAVVIDGNHTVIREAYEMARDVIREMREEGLLYNVDEIALEEKIAEKIAEILHNERNYD